MEIFVLAHSYKRFDQFQESFGARQWGFPLKTRSALVVRDFHSYPLQVANTIANRYGHHSYVAEPWGATQPQPLPRFVGPSSYMRAIKPKKTFWQEMRRLYINEVITFTMNKSTLFTLIFSFMFLGCIFFLGGFFTATSIYKGHQEMHEANRQHVPTETAVLQGRLGKQIDMGSGIVYATPQAYQYQGGVKIDRNRRRPSAYVERQITMDQSNYR